MSARSDIRDQYHTVLADWARAAQVQRFISTVDTTGRQAGAFTPVATDEMLWIQPLSRGTSEILERGVDARTTHLAFQRWDGFPLVEMDKIYDTDEQGHLNEYDVVRAHLKESHRVAELMLPKRNPE